MKAPRGYVIEAEKLPLENRLFLGPLFHEQKQKTRTRVIVRKKGVWQQMVFEVNLDWNLKSHNFREDEPTRISAVK
jgi:hypothetical protein